MGNAKGAAIVVVRRRILALPPAEQERFRSRLSESERADFDQAMAITALPIEFHDKVLTLANQVLYGGQPDGLRILGKEIADDNLRGIYRIFIRIASVPFILSRSATLWSHYHEEGKAGVDFADGEKQAVLYVNGYPSLPKCFREMMCGFVRGCVELGGAKDVSVTNGGDPTHWTWSVRWT